MKLASCQFIYRRIVRDVLLCSNGKLQRGMLVPIHELNFDLMYVRANPPFK